MLRLTSRLLTSIPLAWCIIIVDLAGTFLLFKRTTYSDYRLLHLIPFAVLLFVGGLVLLTFCCRYLLDYTQWQRVQVQRGHSPHLNAYAAYAWCALQRRHRRWPRIPLTELLALDARKSSSSTPLTWLAFPLGFCIIAWVSLSKMSFLAVLILQVVTCICWVLTQRYSPRLHRSWRSIRVDGKVNVSFFPKTYKANRLRKALYFSCTALFMAESGVEKVVSFLQHKTDRQDLLLGLLATFGSATVTGVMATKFWRAYLRWRQGHVTMDDVSEEIEWMLEHRGHSKANAYPDLGEEYLDHRSNIARAKWSWALRKYELIKQLKLRPIVAYIVGVGGVLFAVAVVALGAWVYYGSIGMWVVLTVLAVAIVLGIIAWIVGDGDDLPPRPPANKPVPTPGQARPLPKIRARPTPRVQNH